MTTQLTEPVLFRLVSEALLTFLGGATKIEAAFRPGCAMVLSNEPVADLNCIVVGAGAGDGRHFADFCGNCISRRVPFLAMVFPGAGERVKATAAECGLVHAVDFPIMVRDDIPIEASGNDAVVVHRATADQDVLHVAPAIAAAFDMPADSIDRVLPPSVIQSPSLDVYLAQADGETIGGVVLTHHGDTTGIWAMGTVPGQQRGGVGRRLLSTAMADARQRGARRFFLGATPAGYRLYESLGYVTRVTTSVWAFGKTTQA